MKSYLCFAAQHVCMFTAHLYPLLFYYMTITDQRSGEARGRGPSVSFLAFHSTRGMRGACSSWNASTWKCHWSDNSGEQRATFWQKRIGNPAKAASCLANVFIFKKYNHPKYWVVHVNTQGSIPFMCKAMMILHLIRTWINVYTLLKLFGPTSAISSL